MTQKEKDTAIAWCKAEIERLDKQLAYDIEHTPCVRTGKHANSHGTLKIAHSNKVHTLQRKIAKLEQTTTLPNTYEDDANVQLRIAELQKELAAKLSSMPNDNAHAKIRAKLNMTYKARITVLRRYGVEHTLQRSDIVQRSMQTKLQVYGSKFANRNKADCTMRHRYGERLEVITERRQQTNLLRYGYKGGNMQKTFDTKLRLYGCTFGPHDKAQQTIDSKYGKERHDIMSKISNTVNERYGVPYFCMHTKCRKAHKQVMSKLNHWWQVKLQHALGVQFELDDVNIDTWSYDLHYKHVLIEICPTISHNTAYSYAAMIGKSAYNKPHDKFYHFDKTQLALKHGYVCITVFDWMSVDIVISIVEQHLNHMIVESNDFALNPQLSDDKSTICKHWYNIKTRDHIDDCNYDEQSMLDKGFLPVYDCGHC